VNPPEPPPPLEEQFLTRGLGARLKTRRKQLVTQQQAAREINLLAALGLPPSQEALATGVPTTGRRTGRGATGFVGSGAVKIRPDIGKIGAQVQALGGLGDTPGAFRRVRLGGRSGVGTGAKGRVTEAQKRGLGDVESDIQGKRRQLSRLSGDRSRSAQQRRSRLSRDIGTLEREALPGLVQGAELRERGRRAAGGERREQEAREATELRALQGEVRLAQGQARVDVSKDREKRIKDQFDQKVKSGRTLTPGETKELIDAFKEIFPDAQEAGINAKGHPRFTFPTGASPEETKAIADVIGFVPRGLVGNKISYGPPPSPANELKAIADIEARLAKRRKLKLSNETVNALQDYVTTVQRKRAVLSTVPNRP